MIQSRGMIGSNRPLFCEFSEKLAVKYLNQNNNDFGTMIQNILMVANDRLQVTKQQEYLVQDVHHQRGVFMYEDELINSRQTLFPDHSDSFKKHLPKVKLNRDSENDLARQFNESRKAIFPEYTLVKTGFGILPQHLGKLQGKNRQPERESSESSFYLDDDIEEDFDYRVPPAKQPHGTEMQQPFRQAFTKNNQSKPST